jgi:hypothetical protein
MAAVAATIKPAATLQWILWLWFSKLGDAQVRFRDSVIHAAWMMLRCRTGALGWRSYTCPEHGEEVLPNSCRHRSCPGCVERKSFAWAAMLERRLLDCDYFHVVFTLPHKLLPYWRHNRAVMADCLFDAASGTLKELLAHRDYMGGTPAIVGVLHTHGGALNLHPHVHILVSSAGLSPDGKLVRARLSPSLLPYRVLRRLFQMKFLHLFASRSKALSYHLPKGTTGPDLRRLIDQLFAQRQSKWNVWVFHRPNPAPVVRYLSRTVYGGPIRNDRIVRVDEHHVTFLYVHWRHREEGTGKKAPLSEERLTLEEFVQRWSEHVPHEGQKTVRYWGLLAPNAKVQLDIARDLLGQVPIPPDKPQQDAGDAAEPVVHCRQCGAAMVVRELPPTKPVLSAAASAIIRSRASPSTRDARCDS